MLLRLLFRYIKSKTRLLGNWSYIEKNKVVFNKKLW